MKQLLCGLLVSIGLCVFSLPAIAEGEGLMLSEVKVRNTSTTQTDEFIELHNNSTQAVHLSDYSLEYFNMHDPVAQTVTVHKGPFVLPELVVAPGLLVVLAVKPAMVPGSMQLAQVTALKDDEGSLRLAKAGVVVDELAWKKGAGTAGAHAVPAQSSYSLQRDIADSTWVAALASPGIGLEGETLPETPAEEPAVVLEPEAPAEPEEVPQGSSAGSGVLISELLPNPLAPQTDALDEFVELYNPTTEPIDLAGYVIETGAKYSYKYKVTEGVLASGAYLTFTSGATPLSLANSGGGARLLGPDGAVVYETHPYAQAAEGQAWALVGETWHWTTVPTPAGVNVLNTPTTPADKPAKTTPAKKTATAKPKAATKAATTSKKAAATKAQTDKPGAPSEAPADTKPSSLHAAVVAGIGLLGVAYAAYEYRQDIVNRLYQFRRYRAARREARAKT